MRVPGDKSISHRALILGALTVGRTRISRLLEGEDVINTGKAMRALGARVERVGEGNWQVDGVGVGGFAQPATPLDFGNSGTGCRLMMGAGRLPDHGHVRRRRLAAQAADAARARSADPHGRAALAAAEGGRLPLTLRGARDPIPIVYEPPAASAQLKSAVLLAGLARPAKPP